MSAASAAAARARKLKKKEKKQAKKEENKVQQQEQKASQAFQKDLGSASGLAQEDINKYFMDRGLDPSAYQGDIDRAIKEATLSVPKGAANIPGYFSSIAPNLYGELSSGAQTRALTGIENLFPQGFEQNYIPSTADDAVIAEILGQSRAEADKYAKNLLDRGVVKPSGYEAITGDISGQEAKVKALLDQLGGQVLTQGRTNLQNIFGEGEQAASNLRLGQTFDPTSYQTRINQALSDFTSGLGGNIKALIPEKGLFQTTGLAARGGAAQGAQNTAFDPNALAGIFSTDEENRKATPLSIF